MDAIELEFLNLVGCDTTNGYWQDDVDYYQNKYLLLWQELVKLRTE